MKKTSRKAARPPEGVDKERELRIARQAAREAPSCRDCGSTNIKTDYVSRGDGSQIDEQKILDSAIYAMIDLLNYAHDDATHGGDGGHMTQIRARTLAGLVDMWIARNEMDEGTGTEQAQAEGTAA